MPNFIAFIGRQCGQFAHGCYDGFTTGIDARRAAEEQPIPNSEQIPIHPSIEGKAAIEEALRSNDPNKVIDQINEVCAKEGLSKIGCVQAAYYCSKAVLKGSSELIRGACMNLLV